MNGFSSSGKPFLELEYLDTFINKEHYPAIDILGSISRLMSAIATDEHKEAAGKMRALMSLYRENKDLIDVGMYQMGSNPKLDVAIEMMPQINAFLQQRTSDSVSMDNTIQTLKDMMANVDIY